MIYGGHFEPDKKKERIKILEEETLKEDFWQDKKKSEEVINELNSLKEIVNKVDLVNKEILNNLETLELLKIDYDDEIKKVLEEEIKSLETDITNLEIEVLLNAPYDKNSTIIEIHPGAGGTESQDWALMLKRMYIRWCEKKNYKYEIIDEQIGEEAGIKGVTFIVKAVNAYGYLKSEKGVHRLIRISPFDSNSRRHTSFASVDVTPLFNNQDINIEIKESDIRIDVYRSTGCGGQGVNTTDSAVRITHFPSKIVVTCQNERSQIQNKEKAMEVLKNKLYQLELEKRNKEMRDLKGDVMDVNFGSQIRSYIMHPYSMVKDHRTNKETSNVSKVLDGDIDIFINAYLKGE